MQNKGLGNGKRQLRVFKTRENLSVTFTHILWCYDMVEQFRILNAVDIPEDYLLSGKRLKLQILHQLAAPSSSRSRLVRTEASMRVLLSILSFV